MLKKKITKEEYDANEAFKSIYIESNGNYILDVEPNEPVINEGTVDELGVIKRALARVKEEKIELSDKLQAIEEASTNAGLNTALKDKDIEKLTKHHERELEKANKKTSTRDAFIKKSVVDSTVKAMAAKLAGKHSDVLAPHIRARLSVDLTGDIPELEIFDDKGRSGLTLDELEKSIVDTESFAPILVGSRATGSGASGNQSSGGAGTAKKFDEMSGTELVTLRRNDPAAYDKLKAARDAAKK